MIFLCLTEVEVLEDFISAFCLWKFIHEIGVINSGVTTLLFICGCGQSEPTPAASLTPALEVKKMRIKLPKPKYNSDVSLEESLVKRRSVRDYTGELLTMEEVSQLLWAAQGTTLSRGFRTAPSAGALFPLEVYVIVGDVQDLAIGIYLYKPDKHELVMIADKDARQQLAGAALGQTSVKNGAIDLVFTAVYQRTTRKYGDRGIKYVHMEIGHAAQNVCLQATAMDLGVVTIGAFNDEEVSKILKLPKDEEPLYIIPIGKR
ncbi:MAG: SagB/ThcOx family dehydrogenase [Thermodesulfobacteriota bacterium]|nr:SagB/ThcOx family dehydrogenase [Thermodesulfobacteriota bacterium]